MPRDRIKKQRLKVQDGAQHGEKAAREFAEIISNPAKWVNKGMLEDMKDK